MNLRPRDEILASKKLETDKRTYFFDIKKSTQGEYFKVSEPHHLQRNSVFVDDEVLIEWFKELEKVLVEGGYLEWADEPSV